MARFVNQANGYSETGGTRFSWLWCLLFGLLYFAYKGAWRHAAIHLFFTMASFGLAWLIYPFFAYGICNAAAMRRGMIPADA